MGEGLVGRRERCCLLELAKRIGEVRCFGRPAEELTREELRGLVVHLMEERGRSEKLADMSLRMFETLKSGGR